jgi:hypothetical protein
LPISHLKVQRACGLTSNLLHFGIFFAIFRSIVNALTASLVPVLNAFAIVSLITSIYAIEGVNLFASRDSENFGNFMLSLYTMFQVKKRKKNCHQILGGIHPNPHEKSLEKCIRSKKIQKKGEKSLEKCIRPKRKIQKKGEKSLARL